VGEQGASLSIFTTRTVTGSAKPDLQGWDRKMAQMVAIAGIEVSKGMVAEARPAAP